MRCKSKSRNCESKYKKKRAHRNQEQILSSKEVIAQAKYYMRIDIKPLRK